MQALTFHAIHAALEGAKEIMDVYNNHDFQVQKKEDNSPLTIADIRAHNAISRILNESEIPILSEEGSDIPFSERSQWSRFWLVDPLDGTKEFIKRNGEFTVNIALMEKGTPVAGVVYAPVPGKLYFGDSNDGAFLATNVSPSDTPESITERAQNLPLPYSRNTINVVASKSHLNEDTRNFIARLQKEASQQIETVSIGSSLKLCLVAEGKADIYPRFGPTMEWDTAAGHAVVKAAGKNVWNAQTNEELSYNKQNLLNPYFIVK